MVLTRGQEKGLKIAVERYKNGEPYTVISGAAGTGKAQPVDTLIPTPDGYKQLGDIKVGDYVFDRLGKPTLVLGVFPQGILDCYKVELSDGRVTYCNDEHLWTYYTSKGNFATKSLKDIINHGIDRTYNNSHMYIYPIPVAKAIEYDEKVYDIDPYVIGSFIGNGCCLQRQLTISSNDEENVAEIAKLIGAQKYCKCSKNYNWTFYLKHPITREGMAPIIKFQTEMLFKNTPELLNGSGQKRIPKQYFYGSIQQRLNLIQGLMDTDGHICSCDNGRYNISYSSVNYDLVCDIREILLSLGYVSRIHKENRTEKYSTSACYQLDINISNNEKYKLFRISKKKNIAKQATKVKKHRDYEKTYIINVEKLSYQKEMVCIYVDNPEHLYLTNDYIVTHNTTLVNHIIDALNIPEDKVVYIAYTGKASLVLRNKGCTNAITAHKLLYHAKEKPDGTFEFRPKKCLDHDYKIIILDECSMLPEEMWKLLLSHKVHVIALGDKEQLPPVDGDSKILDNPHVVLDEVVRQALDSPIIRLSVDIRAGKFLEYGGPKECRVIPSSKVSDKLLLGADQILCGKNITRHCLNERLRRIKFGEEYDTKPLEGDKIICLKNDWGTLGNNEEPLVNGMIGTINNIKLSEGRLYKPEMMADFISDNNGLYKSLLMDCKIFTEKETTVNKDNWMMFPKNERAHEFDYAYACTVHKYQGSEAEKVVVYDEWLGDTEFHRKWLYTAVTRSSKMLVVVK